MGEKHGKELTSEELFIERIKPLRTEDVRPMAVTLRKVEMTKLRQSVRYYPLRFLNDGIDAYRYGFDNGAIYYTGTSVELALLALLKDTIKQEWLRNAKLQVDFKWLVNHSDNLLDIDGRNLCSNIRIMRNCYVHYQNIVAHIAWMREVDWPQEIERLKAEFGNDSEVARLIDEINQSEHDSYSKEGMLPIRFEHIEAKKEVIPFIENRYKQYMIWLPQAWSSRKRELSGDEFRNIYGIEAFDALDCIKWAFEVFKKLNLI